MHLERDHTRFSVNKNAKFLGILIGRIWVRAVLFSETLYCEKALDEFEFTFLDFIQASDEERGRHRTARRKIQNNANIALDSTSFF